jgi:hypothetical protein
MKTDFQRGLDAAATYLLGTASDFEEGIDRINRIRSRTTFDMCQLTELTAKAALLKGQAGHIMLLKDNKGAMP